MNGQHPPLLLDAPTPSHPGPGGVGGEGEEGAPQPPAQDGPLAYYPSFSTVDEARKWQYIESWAQRDSATAAAEKCGGRDGPLDPEQGAQSVRADEAVSVRSSLMDLEVSRGSGARQAPTPGQQLPGAFQRQLSEGEESRGSGGRQVTAQRGHNGPTVSGGSGPRVQHLQQHPQHLQQHPQNLQQHPQQYPQHQEHSASGSERVHPHPHQPPSAPQHTSRPGPGGGVGAATRAMTTGGPGAVTGGAGAVTGRAVPRGQVQGYSHVAADHGMVSDRQLAEAERKLAETEEQLAEAEEKLAAVHQRHSQELHQLKQVRQGGANVYDFSLNLDLNA